MSRHAARAAAVALVLLVCGPLALAQSVRRGVRVQVTTIDSGGGWSGTAFIPVPPSRLSATPAACGVLVSGDGRITSGRIRTMHLELRGPTGDHVALPLGTGTCPGATLTLGLEDGSTLAMETGTVTTSLGADGAASGTFTATITSGASPLAVTGEITLAPRTAE